MTECKIVTDAPGGAELAITAMDDDQRMNLGRSTYNFVRALMRDPETRELIMAKKAELIAAGII